MRLVGKKGAALLFIGLTSASAAGASAAAAQTATLAAAAFVPEAKTAAVEAFKAPATPLILLEPAALAPNNNKQAQAQQQQQDPDGGRGMDGKKDPPPRAATRGLRTRARIPTSHHQKLMHELMAAVFLAVGVAIVGLLACCVVRCEASRVCPCLGKAPRAPATEDEVEIEESPGAKAADWPARIDAQQRAELGEGEEGKASETEGANVKDVMTNGVAAPVLLQAASAMWASASSLFGLLGGSGGVVDGKAQDKTQQLEAAEAKEPEWQPAQ